eukprot:TRINITY_DN32571_c0_g1_i1.p1 TRINITY_DN32571_c0_g1~~TRINITY_DN32571_c0_g1_i1.p1  ORF type:complete len:148 (+),score=35.54 TRINITY_DN32571_c0_g1_i1:126-569(+)
MASSSVMIQITPVLAQSAPARIVSDVRQSGRPASAMLASSLRGVSAVRGAVKPLGREASRRFVICAAASPETLTKVRGIIAQQLAVEPDTVTPESKFVDLGADSLDTVEIMMALEEQFEITLDEEGAEKIGTVQEAADLIEAQAGKK